MWNEKKEYVCAHIFNSAGCNIEKGGGGGEGGDRSLRECAWKAHSWCVRRPKKGIKRKEGRKESKGRKGGRTEGSNPFFSFFRHRFAMRVPQEGACNIRRLGRKERGKEVHMHTYNSTIYNVQHAMCNVQCAMCNVQRTMYNIQHTHVHITYTCTHVCTCTCVPHAHIHRYTHVHRHV
jgi:hypothetical protein